MNEINTPAFFFQVPGWDTPLRCLRVKVVLNRESGSKHPVQIHDLN